MGCAFSKRNNPANAHSPLQVRSALPAAASTTGGTTATHGGFPEDDSLTRRRDILEKVCCYFPFFRSARYTREGVLLFSLF